MRRVLRPLFLFLMTSVVVPVSAASIVLLSFLFLPLPATLPEARAGIESQISRIYDINGDLIGVFRQFETTKPVDPADIPEILKQAVIAAEDRRFYEHSGVDIQATLRALWADVRSGAAVQGGSTITQQYVKNTYVGSERSLSRKIREAVVASQLDRQVDKEEILFRYLQQVYLGEGAHGVGAAADTYFRKSVADLSLSEAALLAGLIPAPSRYEPRGNPQLAEQRRRLVLDSMLGEGMITPEEHAEAEAQALWLLSAGVPPPGQPVTVVHPREQVETAHPYFVDYVQRYISARHGDRAVYERGLEIYTTLDPRLQAEAERALSQQLAANPPEREMALVSIEPGSGYVKALVGGRDFSASQVNLALGTAGGGLGRQPGSAFKPFVLAEAFEQGVTPGKTYSGRSGICVAPDYCPTNYGGSSYGTMSLRAAAAKSVNTVFVQLIRDVGVEETMELAKEMGIRTSVHDPAVHGLSIALGSLEVNAIDMASAYGVFAARGERAEPTPVVRVLDSEGVVLEDNLEPERTRVLKESTADNVNDVLQGVLQSGGTAGGRGIGRPAAGKTGTTNDNSDAWFVGYTPALTTAVWIGHPEGRVPMRGVTGGSFPARAWQSFMQAAVKGTPETSFSEPAPITRIADAAKREARRGFDVRNPREVDDTDAGGDFVEELPRPTASPPESTTTTAPGQPDDDPDDDDGDGDGGPGGGEDPPPDDPGPGPGEGILG